MSMTTASTTDQDRYREVARILHDVAKPMRVLSALGWDASVREEFLAGGAKQLPAPTYTQINPNPVLDGVAAARRLLRQGNVVDEWLDREATAIEATALMLSSLGTPAFHAYSRQLYGVPKQPLRFDPATPLELAEQIQSNVAELTKVHLMRPPVRSQSGEAVAAQLKIAVDEHFGEGAPEILVVDELSANAVASTSRIKIRRDAQFTAKDAAQLLNHEAFIHVATGLERQGTDRHPDPGDRAPRHDPHAGRPRRLLRVRVGDARPRPSRAASPTGSSRSQMVIDGADFIEVYRWFLERERNARAGVRIDSAQLPRRRDHRRFAVHQGLLVPVGLPLGFDVRAFSVHRRPARHTGPDVLRQARHVVDRRARRTAQPWPREAAGSTCRPGRSTPGGCSAT